MIVCGLPDVQGAYGTRRISTTSRRETYLARRPSAPITAVLTAGDGSDEVPMAIPRAKVPLKTINCPKTLCRQ